jgi:hypothetical protein
LTTAKKYVVPSTYPDEGATKLLNEWKPQTHAPLVQIAEVQADSLQEVAGD